MTVQTIDSALGRIALTPDTIESRVALFALKTRRDAVDVVFDCTVETRRAIAAGDRNYIGTFSKSDSGPDVLAAIAKVFAR